MPKPTVSSILIPIIIALLSLQAGAQQLYRCDQNGTTTFTDQEQENCTTVKQREDHFMNDDGTELYSDRNIDWNKLRSPDRRQKTTVKKTTTAPTAINTVVEPPPTDKEPVKFQTYGKYAIDGDTFVADINGQPRHIRLAAVDAPESTQEWGKEAKDYLGFAIMGTITIELAEAADRYGRVLAYVWNGTTLINEEILRKGLAKLTLYDSQRRYNQQLKEAYNYAKDTKQGFWHYGGLKQTPSSHRRGAIRYFTP